MMKFLSILRSKIARSFVDKAKDRIEGENNKICSAGIEKNVEYDIVGNNNSITIGNGSIISNFKFYIRGNNHKILIGKNCRLRGGNFWLEDEFGEIVIGDHTTIESAHLAVTEPGKKIIVGKDCMFSYGIELRTGDSHSILEVKSGIRINYAKDIVLEDHVWIGANATILKGCTIGEGSVISIGAIVTKSIPSKSIAAGVPAIVVKEGIEWRRERL